jgi:hypothetical protein
MNRTEWIVAFNKVSVNRHTVVRSAPKRESVIPKQSTSLKVCGQNNIVIFVEVALSLHAGYGGL